MSDIDDRINNDATTCNIHDEIKISSPKMLTPAELHCLDHQNSRMVSEHKANLLEIQAAKYWDLFYKRNETRFFKDRHWTIREFSELLGDDNCDSQRVLFEVGCGVGNFIFPIIEEKLNLKIFACDLSLRAIEIIKKNPLYDPIKVTPFHCDITSKEVFNYVALESVDILTLIFVLSAIHPQKFVITLKIIYQLLKPGGLILFRDYGLYDMAQLRFKPGSKISENFYMRQDGTRCYYFSTDYAEQILKEAGLEILSNNYIHRRTVNKKENIDVPRIFIQIKARKPERKRVSEGFEIK